MTLFVCQLIILFFLLFVTPFFCWSRDPVSVCACPDPPASNSRVGEDWEEGEGSRGLGGTGSVSHVVVKNNY